MPIRALLCRLAGGFLLLLSACREPETGPLSVTAIGGAPAIANPNRTGLDPASAILVDAVAQGLVRFDAAGEIEPALAQSWIVSDDGLRYTFRIRRTEWQSGGRVTAQQVVARLRAALSQASRNPLKPVMGFVGEIEAMTDEVLEITLKGPRANFLQLLAQPEMAILTEASGTGPWRAAAQPDGSVLLTLPPPDDEEEESAAPPVALRGERASRAIARFAAGGADLVTGGTAGDLPFLRAADIPTANLAFDPVAGHFGLAFQRGEGLLADPAARRALAMAVDRDGLVGALAVPGLAARATLLPGGLEELPAPAAPDWAGLPLPARRAAAAQAIAALSEGEPVRVRVAMPEGLGYRSIFAWLRRDWRAIGVEAEPVAPDAEADLRFIDAVAPATMAAWYLRHFTCDSSRLCMPLADQALAAARDAPSLAERQLLLAKADRVLTDAAVFVPIAAPVRWSLVSPRLTGFRRNIFGRHPPGELIGNRR